MKANLRPLNALSWIPGQQRISEFPEPFIVNTLIKNNGAEYQFGIPWRGKGCLPKSPDGKNSVSAVKENVQNVWREGPNSSPSLPIQGIKIHIPNGRWQYFARRMNYIRFSYWQSETICRGLGTRRFPSSPHLKGVKLSTKLSSLNINGLRNQSKSVRLPRDLLPVSVHVAAIHDTHCDFDARVFSSDSVFYKSYEGQQDSVVSFLFKPTLGAKLDIVHVDTGEGN